MDVVTMAGMFLRPLKCISEYHVQTGHGHFHSNISVCSISNYLTPMSAVETLLLNMLYPSKQQSIVNGERGRRGCSKPLLTFQSPEVLHAPPAVTQ
jgi:hypothetical protein